ncbi:MAG: type II CAAX endopeptidase family protein [Lysobacteraceae bacterium]|nr:CPBP family intramembrane metalloprotease [Xanthomonadales bacterium]HPF73650.1 type II CAAX endopeptidase family protein [Xanthomonadaceae bacterium]HRY00436.1 type II CAAX endopeptidase family protein [Xanthomonadaceae bacterium]
MNASGEVIVDARSRSRRLIGWFALFCGLFCLVCYPPILGAGSLSDAQWWVFAIMWSPGIAALLARLVVQRNLHGMGWRPAWRMVTLAWAIPLALCLLVYGSVWLSGLGGFDPSNIPGDVPVAGRIALLATLGVLWSLTRAAGEELGWRGLLLPELSKLMTPARAAVISAIVWALYHYPAILLTDYNSEAPRAYALLMFTLDVFAVSFLMAWLRLRSGSFWPAAMLHASHNLFVQVIFDQSTVNGPLTPYITTEFGAGLTAAYGLLAFWLWRRWPPKPASSS